jgi:hypothetical protein
VEREVTISNVTYFVDDKDIIVAVKAPIDNSGANHILWNIGKTVSEVKGFLNWQNYGDVSIYEGWKLVLSDEELDGEAFKGRYYLLDVAFDPYRDDGAKFILNDCYVDVNDTWIHKGEVMNYIGMTEETYDEVWYAIGCYDYYGSANFGADYDNTYDTEEEILEYLRDKKKVDVDSV